MSSQIRRYVARSLLATLVITSLLSLTVPAATPLPPRTEKIGGRESAPEPGSTNIEVKLPQVLYVAIDLSLAAPAPAPEPVTRPRRVSEVTAVPTTAIPKPIPMPSPQAPGVISTAPMTVGEKFGLWFHSRASFGAVGAAIASGMWKELQDNDDFKKDTVGNYFADSMTRAARSYAFGTTSGFFEKGVFASLFRQDPRYHRSGKTGFGGKVGYAVTRVFVTQGDRCGCHQFNASFLLGGAAASGIANLWERSERTGPMHTVSRFYNHIAITALFNIVKEFVGGQ
jgi:hypothetical protein